MSQKRRSRSWGHVNIALTHQQLPVLTPFQPLAELHFCQRWGPFQHACAWPLARLWGDVAGPSPRWRKLGLPCGPVSWPSALAPLARWPQGSQAASSSPLAAVTRRDQARGSPSSSLVFLEKSYFQACLLGPPPSPSPDTRLN